MPTTEAVIVDSYEEGVSVERDTLSDGSIAWNVVTQDPALRFGCIGEAEARDLAEALRDVSWIEVNDGKELK